MKNIPILLLTLLIIATGGCKKYTDEKAATDRRQWAEELHDSIARITRLQREDSLQIETLRNQLAEEIKSFTQIRNQREVAPYYILSGFRGDYPLTSNGVIARLSDGMQFELIAALSGQKFDAIRIRSSKGGSATSSSVRPDQGLNYTSADGLTTVAFSGEANAHLGKFVAENYDATLSVDFLRNGSVSKSIPLSDARKKCIADTWRLTSSRSMLDSLEAVQVINARKLEILHITLARKTASQPDSINNR